MSDEEDIYGVDGNPINQERSQLVSSRPFYVRELECLERAYADGSNSALAAAVKLCGVSRQPLPKWVSNGVLLALKEKNTGKRGRPTNDQTHYIRWDAVRELRDRREELADTYKPTWEAAYQYVSDMLRGTEAQGEPHSIEASYKKVERIFRKGAGARFYQTGE